MELKDVILATIAELGKERPAENDPETPSPQTGASFPEVSETPKPVDTAAEGSDGELEFLMKMRERLLVLFEGFQSPNNRSVEAKIDLTLNFLEYLLATLDERIERLKKP